MEAADTFSKEAGTQPGVDLNAITDRMEIRKAVQSGNVDFAVERVNDLSPEVRGRKYSGGLQKLMELTGHDENFEEPLHDWQISCRFWKRSRSSISTCNSSD